MARRGVAGVASNPRPPATPLRKASLVKAVIVLAVLIGLIAEASVIGWWLRRLLGMCRGL